MGVFNISFSTFRKKLLCIYVFSHRKYYTYLEVLHLVAIIFQRTQAFHDIMLSIIPIKDLLVI